MPTRGTSKLWQRHFLLQKRLVLLLYDKKYKRYSQSLLACLLHYTNTDISSTKAYMLNQLSVFTLHVPG